MKISIPRQIKKDVALFPSTWSDLRYCNNGETFKTYFNGDRNYFSCELEYEDGKRIKFLINEPNAISITTPLKSGRAYSYKEVNKALEVVLDWRNNRDLSVEKEHILKEIQNAKMNIRNAQSQLKQLIEKKHSLDETITS